VKNERPSVVALGVALGTLARRLLAQGAAALTRGLEAQAVALDALGRRDVEGPGPAR
jgi:hypothetical protein